MKTSEKCSTIFSLWLDAQKEISGIIKDSDNPHFNSKYTSLNSLLDVVKPALNKRGIVFMQVPEVTIDGSCCIVTHVRHVDSGEWIEWRASTPLAKQNAQAYGSAITYLCRYSICPSLGLKQYDDDGSAASGLSQNRNPPPQKNLGNQDESGPMSDEQVKQISALYNTLPNPRKVKFLKFNRVVRVEDLPLSQFNQALKMLQAATK